MPPIDPAGSNSAVQDITGGLLLFPMSGGGMHAQIAGIQFWIIDPHRKCFTPVP